jgi:hypothetical protein
MRRRQGRELKGNIKDDWEDEVPEWQEADQVSDYHTFVRSTASSLPIFRFTNKVIDDPIWPEFQC